MEYSTLGSIVVTIIALLFLVGTGSIIISFFLDPEPTINKSVSNNYSYNRITSSEYTETSDDESGSVILSENP